MKVIQYILSILLVTVSAGICADTTAVIATRTTDAAGSYFVNKNVFYSKASYVNGGITFNYPSGYFGLAPVFNLSLVLTGGAPFSTSKRYQVIATANSTSSTTIRVYRQVGTVSSEASTDEVEVHLWAAEPA